MATVDSELSYELSNQYLDPDFPSNYRDMYVTDVKDAGSYAFKIVHDVFQSGKYKGETMVEVGCGPTIHNLATPSKYYDKIYTSDYAPENIASVKKWMAGDSEAMDWTPLLEVLAEIEGYSDLASGVKDIESRIRQKVKSVIHCDVLKRSIFDIDIKDFDFLLTSGCLEGVCSSREAFISALKNLGSYVKPGGHILMTTAIGMSSVELGGKEIKVLNVDEAFVQSALKEAGFVLEQRFFKENTIPSVDFSGFVILIAEKV